MGNKHTNKYYLRYNDKVSNIALPTVFVEKMLKSVDKGIDIEPLVKCLARFMRIVPGRPNRTTADIAMFAKYIDADYVNEEK